MAHLGTYRIQDIMPGPITFEAPVKLTGTWRLRLAVRIVALAARVAGVKFRVRLVDDDDVELVVPWGERFDAVKAIVADPPSHPANDGRRARVVEWKGEGPASLADGTLKHSRARITIKFAEPPNEP